MAIRITTLAVLALTSSAVASVHAEDFKASCAALAQGFSGSGGIVTAEFAAAGGVQLAPPAPVGVTGPAPDHCLIRGRINERTGIDGKAYAVGYELRLPARWNGKFFFQGGGGGGPATDQFDMLTALDKWVEDADAAWRPTRAAAASRTPPISSAADGHDRGALPDGCRARLLEGWLTFRIRVQS
ncbi:MAG: hypothetical protein WA418_00590 [Bradyrhizobium sp.]